MGAKDTNNKPQPVREMAEPDIREIIQNMPPWARAQARLVVQGVREAVDLDPVTTQRIAIAVARRLWFRQAAIKRHMCAAVEAAALVGGGLTLDIDFATFSIDESKPGDPVVKLTVKASE